MKEAFVDWNPKDESRQRLRQIAEVLEQYEAMVGARLGDRAGRGRGRACHRCGAPMNDKFIKRHEINAGPFLMAPGEVDAVERVLEAGRAHGYGNMISWLQREWDQRLEIVVEKK